MLFNSYSFIFLFLPLTFYFYYFLGRLGKNRIAIGWLVGASLFFYGWWNPIYLYLIITSIIINFFLGSLIIKSENLANNRGKNFLILGVSFNLALLGYFKYRNFFIENLNPLLQDPFSTVQIALPLAISFFTFQQIAFLVDAHRGEIKENNFLNYCLFVTFFPQLIAGPIVRFREMMPQYTSGLASRINQENIAAGLMIFFIGLFKKVVIADGIALYSTPVFDVASKGIALTFYESWSGALSYTFQLYFDFSGYSDMAIGMILLFGFRLPLNFNSPYKAENIIDFWRRWHITLAHFLRDYLYIPLGGNQKGRGRQFANILLTMLLGGLWHGAGWTFVLWGGLHGLCLAINHSWQNFRHAHWTEQNQHSWFWSALSKFITFIIVVFLWVLFRAENLDVALSIWKSMTGMNDQYVDIATNIKLGKGRLIVLLIVVWFMPNTQQIFSKFKVALTDQKPRSDWLMPWLRWEPNKYWAVIIAILSIVSVLSLTRPSEFLYFQF